MIKPVALDPESFVLAVKVNHRTTHDCMISCGWFVLTNSLWLFESFFPSFEKTFTKYKTALNAHFLQAKETNQ